MVKSFYNKNMKKYLILFSILFCVLAGSAHAAGTVTGTLTGHSAGQGYNYYTLIGTTTYALPGNTIFEGGAINGTVYSCAYKGTATAMTSADCSIKSAAVKGYLSGGSSIVDVNDTSKVLAQLPSGTAFTGGKTDGLYYICNYIGSLPKVTSATCSVDSTVPKFVGSGYRLFPDLSCSDTTALSCFVKRVWGWSQTAILTLAIAAFVFAGIIYMTSRGNPKQVESAKKIIIGALSAVAVIILGKFFLTNIVGVPWL